MFLPPELYSWLFWFPYYYGDHIEWDTLESFSIAAEVEKLDWLIKDFAYKHTLCLREVELGSKEPIAPFRYDPLFRAPKHVNNLWVSEVVLASAQYLHEWRNDY